MACTFAVFSSAAHADPVMAEDCSIITLQSVTTLTFKQRVCLSGKELLTPRFALQAAFMSTFSQYANSPHVPRQSIQELPHRVEVHYARQATRDAAEVLVGYWHHEDLRYRKSVSSGFWHRTNAALLNVIDSPDADGNFGSPMHPWQRRSAQRSLAA